MIYKILKSLFVDTLYVVGRANAMLVNQFYLVSKQPIQNNSCGHLNLKRFYNLGRVL